MKLLNNSSANDSIRINRSTAVRDVEHFADDKNTGSGVVISRAVNTLRSDETHPCNRFARRVRTMTINKAEAPDDDCSVDFDDMKRENCKLSSSPTIYGDWTN
ncbi:putative interleukin-4, partial [Trichinella spiralis]|uniref:putative interleukin-4 n=1 Tax=Trichinella spiralis TaxID=6334 RepID=UPI0001EFEFAB